MGVIQGSVNQMLGTAAAAAALTRHTQEQAIANKAKAAELSTDIAKGNMEIAEVGSKIGELDLAHPEWNNEYMTDAEISKMTNDPLYPEWNKMKSSLANELQIKEFNRDVKSAMLSDIGRTPMDRLLGRNKIQIPTEKGGKK